MRAHLPQFYLLTVVLLTVPLFSSCGSSWTDEYKQGADALKGGRFDEAENHLQFAAQAAARAGNAQGQAISVLGLARTHMEEGEYNQAHPLFEQVVLMLEKSRGPNSPALAEVLIEYGACLFQQEEFGPAEAICKRGLSIELRLPKDKQRISVLGTAYNNLGQIAKSREDATSSEALYRSAIEAYKGDTTEAGKTGLVTTYCNLATLFNHEERYEEARLVAAQAMDIQKTIVPSDDLSLAVVLNTVASIDRAELDNEAAANEYNAAILALKRHEGKGSHFERSLCDTMDSLADLETEQSDLDVAEKTYLESIQHCMHARGGNHPCVAERMVDLAELYRDTERYAQAQDLLKRALAIYSADYDSESPIVINTINELSAVYLLEHKFADANALYQEWLPKLRHDLGDNHPRVADALDNWALVADKSNSTAQARELRAQAKEIRLALTKQ